MELVKESKNKCELCKAKSEFTMRLTRLGIKSSICLCDNCLKGIYKAIGEATTPKSIETIRKHQ